MVKNSDLHLARKLFPNAQKIRRDIPDVRLFSSCYQDPSGALACFWPYDVSREAWGDARGINKCVARVVRADFWHNKSFGPWPERQWNAYGEQGDFANIPSPDFTPYAFVIVDGESFVNSSANMAESKNWGRNVTFFCFKTLADYKTALDMIAEEISDRERDFDTVIASVISAYEELWSPQCLKKLNPWASMRLLRRSS
jgi:hypothetical protein